MTVASSFVLILAFWTGVSLGSGMVVPAAIGFGLLYDRMAGPRRRPTLEEENGKSEIYIRSDCERRLANRRPAREAGRRLGGGDLV